MHRIAWELLQGLDIFKKKMPKIGSVKCVKHIPSKSVQNMLGQLSVIVEGQNVLPKDS